MRNCTMVLALLAALVLVVGNSARAAVIDVNDPLVPSGFSVGDKLHLAFVSTSTRNAAESDPATDDFGTWDALVNGDAGSSSLSGVGDYTWYAIVSTSGWQGSDSSCTPYAVDGKDHAFVSAPVYLLDGSKIADGYATLWDGDIDHAFNVDEDGNTVSGSQSVWTGSNSAGTHHEATRKIGGNYPMKGYTDKTSSQWVANNIGGNGGDRNNPYRVYALSEELTVATTTAGNIPEPSALLIWGLGLLGLAWYRRRRRK